MFFWNYKVYFPVTRSDNACIWPHCEVRATGFENALELAMECPDGNVDSLGKTRLPEDGEFVVVLNTEDGNNGMAIFVAVQPTPVLPPLTFERRSHEEV